MNKANNIQWGGVHYKHGEGIEVWDFAYAYRYNNFESSILRYIVRYKKKNGLEDIRKAIHYLQKYIEVTAAIAPRYSYVGISSGGELQRHESDCVQFCRDYKLGPNQTRAVKLLHIGDLDTLATALTVIARQLQRGA